MSVIPDSRPPRIIDRLPHRAEGSEPDSTIDTDEFAKALSTRSRNKTDRVGAVEAGQLRNANPWSIGVRRAEGAMSQLYHLADAVKIGPDLSEQWLMRTLDASVAS